MKIIATIYCISWFLMAVFEIIFRTEFGFIEFYIFGGIIPFVFLIIYVLDE